MGDKFISVLMATYNGELFLEKQLESILNQTHLNFELIICDDMSTDSTFELLKSYLLIDKRIRVIRNSENLGFKKNFEKLMSMAQYDFFAFSDQDDIWHELHLEKLLSNLGNKDLVCGNSVFIDKDGSFLGKPVRSKNCNLIVENQEDLVTHLCHSNFIQGSALMVRKSLVDEVLPIPDGVKFHDYWLGINAALRNGVSYTSDNILYYRNHGRNATNLNKESLYYRVFKVKSDYSLQIEFLDNVIAFNKGKCVQCLNELDEAIFYYRSLQGRTNFFYSLKYFFHNYRKMYLTSSKKLLRFLKVFVFKY